MGVIFLDGADHLSSEQIISKYNVQVQWGSGGSLGNHGVSVGRFGGGAWGLEQFFGVPMQVGRSFSLFSAIFAGVYHYRTAGNAISTSPILLFREDGITQICLVTVDPLGTVAGASGASAENFRLYATSASDVCGLSLVASFGTWVISAWDLLEMAVSHGTGNSGSVQVYISGNLAVSFTGDLEVGGKTGINEVLIGSQNTVTPGNYYDDFYILNEIDAPSALQGIGHRIFTHYPASEGTVQEFTPGSGSDHYTEIDDPLFHDASNTFLSVASAGLEERIILSSPAWSATVKGFQLTVIAEAASGTPGLHMFYDLSGATVSGATSALSATWGAVIATFNSGPGGSAWRVSAFSNIEVGVQMP